MQKRSSSLRWRAGRQPRGEDLALLRRHRGEVARRHGIRAHRVDLDQMRVTADVVGIVEHNSFGRRMHARPHRFVAMTHAAAGEDRIVCSFDVEAIGGWTDLRGSGGRTACRGTYTGCGADWTSRGA